MTILKFFFKYKYLSYIITADKISYAIILLWQQEINEKGGKEEAEALAIFNEICFKLPFLCLQQQNDNIIIKFLIIEWILILWEAWKVWYEYKVCSYQIVPDQGFLFQDIHKLEGTYVPQSSIHIIHKIVMLHSRYGIDFSNKFTLPLSRCYR